MTLIQKGGLCPLRLLLLMTEFSLFMPLQGIASGNRWLWSDFLKKYKIIWKIKMRKMKKSNTWSLNCTMDKINRDSKNKTKKFYRCCSSYALSKLIVDNGLEDLCRRKNPDSLEVTHYNRSYGKNLV